MDNKATLAAIPIFSQLNDSQKDLILQNSKDGSFTTGSYMAKQDDPANHFYIIKSGRVAIEVLTANHNEIIIETLREHSIVGWSWLFPPYQWAFDIKVMADVEAIVVTANPLRDLLEKDKEFGYEIMRAFSHIFTERLFHTRMQLIDMYNSTYPGKISQ